MTDNEQIHIDGSKVHVDLVHPVQVGNRKEILTVTLRRPTLKDIMSANAESSGNDLKENLALLRHVGGLTRAELDAMDWGDDVQNLLLGLTVVAGKSQPTGDPGSEP